MAQSISVDLYISANQSRASAFGQHNVGRRPKDMQEYKAIIVAKRIRHIPGFIRDFISI